MNLKHHTTTLAEILKEFEDKFAFLLHPEWGLKGEWPEVLKSFIATAIKDALEVCEIEAYGYIEGKYCLDPYDPKSILAYTANGWNNALLTYRKNVSKFLGKE